MLKRAILSRDIEDVLLSRIATGAYRVGDRLPTERELAETLGISRGAVREALNHLHRVGLIRIVRGKGGGWFVANPDSEIVSRALSVMLIAKGVTNESLVEARVTLAPPIAAFAAARATPRDIAVLEGLCDLIDTDEDPEAVHEARVAFHRKVAEMSGNPILEAAMVPLLHLVDTIGYQFSVTHRRSGLSPIPTGPMRALTAALAAHSPEDARAAMMELMNSFAKNLQGSPLTPPWVDTLRPRVDRGET
jgi:GntR family transcriptional repressor for pyruvate dehydrogenase complex